MSLFQPPGVKVSCVEQRPSQPLQQPWVPVEPVALRFRRTHQAVEEPEWRQDPVGQPVAVQSGVAGSQDSVRYDGAAASERSVQAATAPLLHEGHGRESGFALGREDALARPDLTGENCPEFPCGIFTGLLRRRRTVCDEYQVGGSESDVKSRPRADDVEGLGGVGLAVQERKNRAVDQRSAAVRCCRGQDLVAGPKVTHGFGGATFQGDQGVARETAA